MFDCNPRNSFASDKDKDSSNIRPLLSRVVGMEDAQEVNPDDLNPFLEYEYMK